MQNNQEQYDFYLLGQRYANHDIHEVRHLADSYEQEFGRGAREDFEAGVVSVIPHYAFLSPSVHESLEELKLQGGSLHFSQESFQNMERQRLQIKRRQARQPYPEEYHDSPKTR